MHKHMCIYVYIHIYANILSISLLICAYLNVQSIKLKTLQVIIPKIIKVNNSFCILRLIMTFLIYDFSVELLPKITWKELF